MVVYGGAAGMNSSHIFNSTDLQRFIRTSVWPLELNWSFVCHLDPWPKSQITSSLGEISSKGSWAIPHSDLELMNVWEFSSQCCQDIDFTRGTGRGTDVEHVHTHSWWKLCIVVVPNMPPVVFPHFGCHMHVLQYTVLPVMSHHSTNLQVAVTCQDTKQFNKLQSEQLPCAYACTLTTSSSDFF